MGITLWEVYDIDNARQMIAYRHGRERCQHAFVSNGVRVYDSSEISDKLPARVIPRK